jgi:quercetin 2,3-dioxygenase
MNKIRKVEKIVASQPTIEGAGVKLYRAFAQKDAERMDPFLLLDHFASEKPEDYIAGFPWHPHRGIETVTYMIRGEIEHQDSLGNKGVIRSGDVQWMTAGSGIIHQEMPKKYSGKLEGFQLWVNLPRKNKMMDPRYRGIEKSILPELSTIKGKKETIIAGKIDRIEGPVRNPIIDVEYLDIELQSGGEFLHQVNEGHTAFAYVFEGEGIFGNSKKADGGKLVLFERSGGTIKATSEKGVRFMFASGKPIKEPIVWGGPIVMNTKEELKIALEEYEKGTFLKHAKP